MKILSLGRLDVTIRRELQRACCHCGTTVGRHSLGPTAQNFPSQLQRCFVSARHTPPITSVPHDSASGGDVHRLVAVHFFVVPLPHPNRRNCPEKGHDAVQSPRLQSPRPFVDWVDWCGCGGCCLGCHRTDLVTLYVLRELGNHLLELLDTCLQNKHPHVSTDKRTPMHHVYHIRSASGTGCATMQVCQAGTDEVHVSNVGVTMALVSDTG